MEHKFAGVNIDFEQLNAARSFEAGRRSCAELRAKLKPSGYLIAESVPSDDDVAYDLKKLAEINDYIVPMVYDEHYQTGKPGPIASEEWFQGQIDHLATLLPARKNSDRLRQLRLRLDYWNARWRSRSNLAT